MTLREIALKHRTDKAGGRDNPHNHEYCEAYEFFLSPWRNESFAMIELGIGGYHFPDRGGEGLRTWREYFTRAEIHGVDVHPKTFQIEGVNIHHCSQDDPEGLLNNVLAKISPGLSLDLIIDDASHENIRTIASFMILFPYISPGALYVVEDAHTSYWEKYYGGGWHTLTAMEYFKHQADGLNKIHWPGEKPCEFLPDLVEGIESIHFYKELIFIRKKS